MIYNEEMIRKYLSCDPDECLEMVDQTLIAKTLPPEDEWGYPQVEVFFQQKRLTIEEMNQLLQKNEISLLEGAHLLIGLKISRMSSSIISEPILYVYEKAIIDIRTNKLKVERVDTDQYWIRNSFNEEIIVNSNEEKCIIRIRDTRHGVAHYFKPHIFLDWALSLGMLLHDDLLGLIGVRPVAKRLVHNLNCAQLYLPTNNIAHGDPILLTQHQREEIALLATAQVIWEIEDPDMTIAAMENHKMIKKWIPGGSYANRHIFRNKVKIINPRPKCRNQKNAVSFKIQPYPPKTIPGVLQASDKEQVYRDFPRLKIVLKTIIEAILVIKPSIEIEQLRNHRLIALYTTGIHPMINAMVVEWIEESIKFWKSK